MAVMVAAVRILILEEEGGGWQVACSGGFNSIPVTCSI